MRSLSSWFSGVFWTQTCSIKINKFISASPSPSLHPTHPEICYPLLYDSLVTIPCSSFLESYPPLFPPSPTLANTIDYLLVLVTAGFFHSSGVKGQEVVLVFSVARRRRRKGDCSYRMHDRSFYTVSVYLYVCVCVCVFIYFTFSLIIRSLAPTSFFKICFNFPHFMPSWFFPLLHLSLVIFLISPFFLHNSSLPRRSCLSSNNKDRVL